jgi:hypothetical protein
MASTRVDPPVVTDQVDALPVGDLGYLGFRPEFPAIELIPVAAGAMFDAAYVGRMTARRQVDGCLAEGPAISLTISPGSVKLSRRYASRAERAQESALRRRRARVGQVAAYLRAEATADALDTLASTFEGLPDGESVRWAVDPLAPSGRSRITEWSRKSIRNMTERLMTLDYRPLVEAGTPALCTLTLPDEWEQYAPTGKAFHRLIRNFQKRYARAWGRELVGVWKLEFQRRGAPHLHMLIVPQLGAAKCGRTWRRWYSETWADVLGVTGETRRNVIGFHSDPKTCADYAEGLRMSDPKRIGIYFTKHALLKDKEYQNIVPKLWCVEGAGPGRFWGRWGLPVIEAAVEVTYDQAVKLARTMRRLERARGAMRQARVQRVDVRTGLVRRRTVRRRLGRMPGTFGFLAVNDGAGYVFALSRCLESEPAGTVGEALRAGFAAY